MATHAPIRSGFEKWMDGIDKAIGNPKWQIYDCEIQIAVAEYNRHLTGVAGYHPLDWRLVKAMAWVETGAADDFWLTNPMQIGMYNDPGLDALLSGKEGGGLILPPAWKARLTRCAARSIPAYNIRAGIGYLLMRLANFSVRSLPTDDRKTYEIAVKAGDSLDKIARAQGSTIEVMRRLNPGATILRPGQVLNVQKATIGRIITGWKPATTANIGRYYNARDPVTYAKKLDYALAAIHKGTEAACKP